MKVNTDINILGGLPDWNLIHLFLKESLKERRCAGSHQQFTAIKTDKSVKRFERAITESILTFKNPDIEALFRSIINAESISPDSLLMIFWNVSLNNELFDYLNRSVFFPAFYSGRISISMGEGVASLNELQETNKELKKWSASTIEITASKYLTLMKKFRLMEGTLNKTILHPYLSDKMLILFVYWLIAIENKPNILSNPWLQYSFSEKEVLVERIVQRKFSKFFNLFYTGDRLNIELKVPFEEIYHAAQKS